MGRQSVVWYSNKADNPNNSNHYVEYVYDKNNWLLKETQSIDGELTITEYTYDDDGNVLTKSINGSEVLSFDYSKTGQKTGIEYTKDSGRTILYEYDQALGRLNYVKQKANASASPTVVATYSYNTDGTLASIAFANGTTQYFTYGGLNNLVHVEYKKSNGTIVEKYDITYDDLNKIKTETSTYNYTGTAKTSSKAYEYNTLGNMVKSTIDGKVMEYGYDKAGNRTSSKVVSGGGMQNNFVTQDTYDIHDRLTSSRTDYSTPRASGNYAYDISGNRTKKEVDNLLEATPVVNAKDQSFEFDAANRLTKVKNYQGSAIAEFKYDAQGQRLQKKVGSTVTNYVYDGINLLYTYNSGAAIVESNVLEPEGNIISCKQGVNNYWYRKDIRGSITNIVGDAETVAKSYTYDAFGVTVGSGAFTSSFAYTGSVYDPETDLYYMNARYYDENTGNFITADKYSIDPMTYWNLYSYCNGDPINCIDLTGYASYDLYTYPSYAAKNFVYHANPKTHADNLERCTMISKYTVTYRKNPSTKYTRYAYCPTKTGVHDNVIGWFLTLLVFPEGNTTKIKDKDSNIKSVSWVSAKWFAHTHTHCTGHDGENFSDADKSTVTTWGMSSIYLGTPKGRVKRWRTKDGTQTLFTGVKPAPGSPKPCPK